MNTKPYIEGDHIVNATRGKAIAMKCTVHNIKNYKVCNMNFNLRLNRKGAFNKENSLKTLK